MRLPVFVVLLCLSATAGAQIYKWVDEDGRVHYGSRPQVGATVQDVTSRVKSLGNFVTTEALPDSATTAQLIMLSTDWCKICKKAKAWLNLKGISFTELNVEKDSEGKRRYKELNGKGVPIFLYGKQRMNGFNPGRLEQMLTAGKPPPAMH